MSASSLNAFTVQFNRFILIPTLILGLIGNVLNILIFTRRRLIKNPCSTFFLCSSITNLNVLFFGLIPRFLSDGFNIDPSLTNLGFCRFRYFILHSSMVVSSWFIILAGIDRYCLTSRNVHHRRWSNLKHARYSVLWTTLIVSAMYSHVFGLFTIEQLRTGPYCYAQAGAYRIFYDFFYFTTYSCAPPIIMVIFGLATFYNIQQMRRQIAPTNTANTNIYQLRKRDRQLTRMLLIEFIFTVVLTLPIAIQKLYATFTQNTVKDPYRLAAENFVVQLMRIFVYIDSSTSFYIFILSGEGFRHEFGQMMINIVRFICGENCRFFTNVNRPVVPSNRHET